MHAAFRARYDHRPARIPVHRDTHVELFRDVRFFLNKDFPHGEAVDLRDQKLFGHCFQFLRAGCAPDAAGKPAASDQDLCLEHDRVSDLSGHVDRLLHRARDAPPGDGNAHRFKNIGCLEFMESHG